MSVLSAQGVRVAFAGHAVLDGVDLEVRAGEVVALVGPNGAGKSTLLSVLAGDTVPDAGAVRLDAVDVRALRPGELARRRAVQPQETRVSFPFEVADVVAMGRAPWRHTARADDDDTIVARAMATADVADLARRRYPTLSGGEKARTTFARVLAQEGGVLLLDEPTAALDVRHQEALLDAVRRLAGAGAAVVVVLHDLTLAAAYADRVVVLADGAVRGDGPPGVVLTAELLTAVYRHPIEVVDVAGDLVVLPVRPRDRVEP